MKVWLLLLFLSEPFDTRFRTGVIALSRGDLREAQSQLESAAEIEPLDSRVWLALAQTYWRLEKTADAKQAASRAETNVHEPAMWHGLSMFYADTAAYGKAAEMEARFCQTTPAAIPRAMDLFLRAGQPKNAIAIGLGAPASAKSAALSNLLGKAYQAEGDPAAAVTRYREATHQDPYDEAFHFDLVQANLRQQKFAAALDDLGAAHKYFDKSPQLELAGGVAYYGLRRFPEAIDSFLRTIQLDPTIEQPYVFLSRMLDQAEDRLPRIVAVFASLADKAPGNYLACFLYGKALSLENPGKAEDLLRQSIAANAGFWESHFELGVLLERQSRLDDAAKEIRRSAELNANDPAPHYRLARLYARLGKNAEARAEKEAYEKLTATGHTADVRGIK